MASDFVALLRGISNMPMQPLRDALSGIGLVDVRSFGATGNLFFNADGADPRELERRIVQAVGVETFVRTRAEMTSVVADDPFVDRPGASVFFARSPLSEQQLASLNARGFEGEPPVASGAQLYFVHPLQRPGLRSVVDLERELGVRGTMRASRVVARILQLM